MTARRLRLTRRGRIVLTASVVLGVVGVTAASRGGGAGLEAPGVTAGVAAEIPSPTPSPDPGPPAWDPAVPASATGDLAVLDPLVTAAPLVVLAEVSDRHARDAATWLATRLQAPVVDAGTGTGPSPAPVRLPTAAHTVVAVGGVTVAGDAEVRRVPLAAAAAGAPADPAAGPLQVRRAARVAAAAEPPVGVDLVDVEDLLGVARPARDTGVVLLARPGGATVDAVATALALGHEVVVTGADDPRADEGLRRSLADASHIALLGAGWDDLDRVAWAWQLPVVQRGLELPGGGQLVFPGRMIVALYGHPDGPALGVLGEQPLQETLVRAAEQAAVYDDLVDVPVVPALEIIATVASAAPGPRGDYSRRTTVEQLRPYVDAAREAGVFVVLDLQPGRTDFLSQAKEYEELLREPHVGLALDPEWRLGPNDRHLVRIGSVGADEVNAVASWLAELTRREALPQKLLVLHQFKHSMIAERERIDTSHRELAMVLHVDGQGGQPAKLATYASMLRDLSPDVWIGWKNFHDEDRPMRSEAETVTLDPLPVLVTYQ